MGISTGEIATASDVRNLDTRKGARVTHSAAQSIPDGSLTALTWDTESYDTDTNHSTVTNASRLTCNTAGKYLLYCTGMWATSSVGTQRRIELVLNATTYIVYSRIPPNTTVMNDLALTVYNMATGDYVEAQVYQDSGGNLNFGAAAGANLQFAIQKVG